MQVLDEHCDHAAGRGIKIVQYFRLGNAWYPQIPKSDVVR